MCPRKPTRCFVYNLMFEIHSLFKFNNLHRWYFHSVRAARTFNESNLMCTNVKVHTIKISYICLKRKTRSPFTVYVFSMFFCHLNVLCLLMIHVSHYIILYFAMLIRYVWPLNLLTNYTSIVLKRNCQKKTFKYISKYNTIYKDLYPYHKCNWPISTSDIYINTLFLSI